MEELAQEKRLLRQTLRLLVLREQVSQLVAEHSEAARLEDDNRRSGLEMWPERVQDVAQLTLRPIEKAVVVQRPAAAQGTRRQHDVAAGSFEHLGCCDRSLRPEVVVEGVRPEYYAAKLPRSGARAWSIEPLDKRSVGKAGHLARLRNSTRCFDEARDERRMRGKVDEARRRRRKARPEVDESHGVGRRRTDAVFVIVRQEFGFAGRHVDADRAIAFAPFTRETQIERVFYVFVVPAADQRIALEHFEEQPCAPARRVLLFARHTVARAHRAAMLFPALADTDAPRRHEREAVVVVRVLEMRHDLRRPVAGAQPKILIDAIRVDDLPRVHLSVGIPDRLELAERLDELVTEHFRQKLRARLTVAVLAGERSAVCQHEIGGLVHERLVCLDALRCLEIEIDARVDAALAEMAVQGATVLILVEQLAEAAQVRAKLRGRNRGILPALPGDGLIRYPGGRAERRLANSPNELLVLLVVVQLHRRRVALSRERGHRRARPAVAFRP